MFQFPMPPFGPGFDFGPPVGSPPEAVPEAEEIQEIGVQAVDPGAIRRCRFRFVYLRLRRAREFRAWLTFAGRRSVAGWRWTGFRWVYFGVNLRQIIDFE